MPPDEPDVLWRGGARGGELGGSVPHVLPVEVTQTESCPLAEARSIVDVVRMRAARTPTSTALVFLHDGEDDAEAWSYERLWRETSRIAFGLSSLRAGGERVVLLFETGLQYVAAFLGVLSASAVAVPLYPPLGRRVSARMESAMADCAPRFVLHSPTLQSRRPHAQTATGATWLSADDPAFAPDIEGALPPPAARAIAMLQYTSGSTGHPKGVVLTHENVMANCQNVYDWLGPDPVRRGCIWLPPYHDMGLLGGILQPLFAGYPLVFMSPLHFVQRPRRWLEAISKYRVTLSGGPNFAYKLCVDAVHPTEVPELDLSCWREAFCGAEIIQSDTRAALERHFAAAGFPRDAFNPCYGLAEATLLVTGKKAGTPAKETRFARSALERGRAVQTRSDDARTLVSCGVAPQNVELKIVDPQTSIECEPGEAGEVWVSGKNVAAGYWGCPPDSPFGACLPGSEGSYLRTGDLGVIWDGELYITGRLKDLIIIAGRNHHPEDIESTVSAADPLLALKTAAAFSVLRDGVEQLVVVAEAQQSAHANAEEFDRAVHAIRACVTTNHGVTPWQVLLCRRGTIPRTTSGKVRRSAARDRFEQGSIAELRLRDGGLP